MKFASFHILAVTILAAISSSSSAYPLVKRVDATFNVNPLLLNVPFPTVTPNTAGGFDVGTSKVNVASLPDALLEGCKQRFDQLQQTLADCKVSKAPECNKLNGQPIDTAALTKDADQCPAHQLVQNGNKVDFDPSIFGTPTPPITQTGNVFSVSGQDFNSLSEAVIGSCKAQRKENLDKLSACATAPSAECNQLDGTPITREQINKQNSACFSHGADQA